MLPAIPFVRAVGGGSGSGSGDVTGPASSTDTAVALFNGATGKILQNSGLLVSAAGRVTVPGRLLGKQGTDVASAADPALGEGNFFVVTGNATIRSFNDAGWTRGSVITLRFTGTATLSNDDGAANFAPFALAGSVSFAATPGDTITLVLDDGGYWREVSRAVV